MKTCQSPFRKEVSKLNRIYEHDGVEAGWWDGYDGLLRADSSIRSECSDTPLALRCLAELAGEPSPFLYPSGAEIGDPFWEGSSSNSSIDRFSQPFCTLIIA